MLVHARHALTCFRSLLFRSPQPSGLGKPSRAKYFRPKERVDKHQPRVYLFKHQIRILIIFYTSKSPPHVNVLLFVHQNLTSSRFFLGKYFPKTLCNHDFMTFNDIIFLVYTQYTYNIIYIRSRYSPPLKCNSKIFSARLKY